MLKLFISLSIICLILSMSSKSASFLSHDIAVWKEQLVCSNSLNTIWQRLLFLLFLSILSFLNPLISLLNKHKEMKIQQHRSFVCCWRTKRIKKLFVSKIHHLRQQQFLSCTRKKSRKESKYHQVDFAFCYTATAVLAESNAVTVRLTDFTTNSMSNDRNATKQTNMLQKNCFLHLSSFF